MPPCPSSTRPKLLLGDCLEILKDLPASSIDLAYLDPPFNTGRRHTASEATYSDIWPSLEEYIAFLRPRIEAISRTLKANGAILLHCDWRTSHHCRLMLDEVYGPENFVNHLIWFYGLGGSSRRRFARKHDDVLFYAKSLDYYFAPPLVPATSQRMKGKMKKATDVIDIPAINNMANERAGYPTQKPLALLELLIEACCPKGGMVLDPFCGSGTTLVAACKLCRKSIGIDANADAVRIAGGRLREVGFSVSIESLDCESDTQIAR